MSTTEEFLIDLGRRRRYRGWTPQRVVEAASDRVVSDDSPLVLELAMISNSESDSDRVLDRILGELDGIDADRAMRELEIRVTCREIAEGQIAPIKGGAQLQQLFYADEDDELLLPFWRLMAESDDLDYRPELERELTQQARATLEALGR